jgi:D-arginine utilization repressor
MPDAFSAYRPVAQAVAVLLHPYAEVVIHDLKTDRIVDIWNAFSNRSRGDESLLGDEIELSLDRDVFGPYEKAKPDGTRLKAITSVLRDGRGRRIGLMCINIDLAELDRLSALLTAFTGASEPRPQALFNQDWREQTNLMVRDFLERRRKALKALDRDDRAALIAEFDAAGVFGARNAAPYVAQALNISRATLYTLLGATRSKKKVRAAR